MTHLLCQTTAVGTSLIQWEPVCLFKLAQIQLANFSRRVALVLGIGCVRMSYERAVQFGCGIAFPKILQGNSPVPQQSRHSQIATLKLQAASR